MRIEFKRPRLLGGIETLHVFFTKNNNEKQVVMDNFVNIEPNRNLLYGEEVYNIVNCAFEVLNMLGHGLLEKPYENALCVEFMARQIPYEQQKRFNIVYKNH